MIQDLQHNWLIILNTGLVGVSAAALVITVWALKQAARKW